MTLSNPPVDDPEKAPQASEKRSNFGLEAFGIAASRFFLRTAGFFSSLIIARLLGAEGRGLVSALTVPSQIAITVSELGIRQATAFFLGRKIIPLERLFPTLMGMIPLASVLGMALSLGYFEYAGVAKGDWVLRLLAVALIPIALVTSYCTGVFLGMQRVAEFRKASWRPALVSLALLVGLAWVGQLGVYGAMIAPLGGALLGAGYALYIVRKMTPLRIGFDRGIARQLQVKGISYAASFLVLTLNYRVMILMLTRFSTLDQVGIYAQAIVIAELIWEIPNALTAIVLSRAVNSKQEREFSIKVQVLARISFLTAMIVSLGIAIFAPIAFPLVFGRSFANSSAVCITLLPGIVAFIVFKILSIDMAGRGKPWATMFITIPVLLLNIVLGYFWIEQSAAIGAARASSLCYVIAAVGYVILYSRMTKFTLGEILLFRRSDFQMLMRAVPLGKLGKIRKKLFGGR